MSGQISNANYSCKKQVCILFINNRLVDCQSIKKTVEAVYSKFLPRGAHPFFWLSIKMNPANLDVNVHPTKREVHFLHEEGILADLTFCLEGRLAAVNESRTFLTQTVLPGAQSFINEAAEAHTNASEQRAIAANAVVRTNDPNPVGQ